jgi:DNA-binding transcriptional ArsR family regulator
MIWVAGALQLHGQSETSEWKTTTILKINLRNRIVAHIFATNQFHIKSNTMRRDIFQAIADPTRRAIITLIALHAMTPNAIAENFNTTRQSVSKHLRILTECELVKQEQQGREIYYSLEIEKMKEIDKWLNQFRKIWETRFNQLDKVLSTMKKQKK